jgi:hypothetical protein
MADENMLSELLSKVTGVSNLPPKKNKRGGLLGAAAGAMKIPGFKHGGKVKKTGIYKLHKGERVLTAKKSHPGLDY